MAKERATQPMFNFEIPNPLKPDPGYKPESNRISAAVANAENALRKKVAKLRADMEVVQARRAARTSSD